MKILILGRDGQVGQALQPAWRPLGEVTALGRAEANLEQPGELPRLVASHAPEVIVNAAAYTAVDKAETEPERARLVNAESVAMLAAAARRSGAWLVHFSTDYVFDGTKSVPYVETDTPNPLSVYGATKHKGDLEIAESGCRHLIFRISWVYAKGHANFPTTILRLARERSALSVVADQVGAPTSAALIAAVTATAVRRLAGDPNPEGLSGVYHLAAAGEVSRCDFAKFLVTEALGCGMSLALRPDAITPVAATAYPTPAKRPLNSRFDTNKLRQAFGIDLPPWQEGARQWVAETAREAST
jgi:dTDP-4-dehydrorhamnose reductase